MNNKIILGVLAVLVVAGGLWYASSTMNPAPQTNENMAQINTPAQGTQESSGTLPASPADTAAPLGSVKEFTVTGQDYSFTPSTLTVKKGDTVRIAFKNVDGIHDFRIDEFNAATTRIKEGAEATVEFVASKTGSFEYYCSVGAHRAMGMKGTLTVTE